MTNKFACAVALSLSSVMMFAPAALGNQQMEALTVLTQDNNIIHFGALNVTTGVYKTTPDLDITLEDSPGCFWAPLVGQEGVGTATFHGNRSYFILAQQMCGTPMTKVNQTVMIATRVAMYAVDDQLIFNSTEYVEDGQQSSIGDYTTVWHTFPGDTYNFPLSAWNMVWDHACNYIVTVPRHSDKDVGDVVFETWMVSE